MLPLMLNMYVGRLGEAGAPLQPRIESEIANHLGYVDGALAGRDWLVGDELTGADIQMSFVGEVAGAFGQAGHVSRTSRPGSSASRRGRPTTPRWRRAAPTTWVRAR